MKFVLRRHLPTSPLLTKASPQVNQIMALSQKELTFLRLNFCGVECFDNACLFKRFILKRLSLG